MSSQSGRYLLAAAGPLALAAGSWYLGGNEVWGWATAASGIGLLLLGAAGARAAALLQPRHYLLFGYLVLCWCAWTAPGTWWPATAVRVKPGSAREPDCPLRVSYRGTLLAELDRPQPYSFSIRGKLRPQALKVEVLTPRGWVERPFHASTDEAMLEDVPLATLYIDNRGCDETTLACGELTLRLGADERAVRRIPLSEDGPPFPVALDGKEVGLVEGEYALIDVLGWRSYRVREVLYSDALDRLLQPARPEAGAYSFHGRHVHKLRGPVDFFLEAAPPSVQVQSFQGLPTGPAFRTELLDAPP